MYIDIYVMKVYEKRFFENVMAPFDPLTLKSFLLVISTENFY